MAPRGGDSHPADKTSSRTHDCFASLAMTVKALLAPHSVASETAAESCRHGEERSDEAIVGQPRTTAIATPLRSQ